MDHLPSLPAPMSSFKRFVGELHRRSVWQVLGVFLAASWGVVEVVDLLTEQVGLPDWTPTMALVLLLIGLPVVLATAIVQEGLPGQDDGSVAAAAADAPQVEEPANLAPGTGSLDRPSTRPSKTRRLLTWRNAILGGVGAFTLLGVSIFAYFVMWTSGVGPVGNLVAQGVFEEGETILLADFADETAASLGGVVTEAIRVDLSESPVLRVLPPAYVSAGLARMGRSADARFDARTARELALRDGIKAVIQGEVAPVGSGFLLTASVVAAESGEVLKAFRVPVASEDELLAGIDKLSQDIREQSGESLRSIKSGTGLEEATTASLDALRLYTEAEAAFDEDRQLEAVPLLEEALELDPEFAMAWRKLSVIYNNRGLEPERMHEASTRAYELRRRLTEREAGLAEAWYHSIVEDNPEAAIEAYRRVLDRYPDDGTALNNIAVRFLGLGRWSDAEEPLRRMMTGVATSANGYANFTQVLWNVGKREEAWAWHDSLAAAYPDALIVRSNRLWLLAGEHRWEEAHELAEGLVRDAPRGGLDHLFALAEMAGSDLARGRWGEAEEHWDAARREAREVGGTTVFYQGPGYQEVLAALALQGPEAARSVLAEVRAEIPVEGLGARSGIRAGLAGMHALAGDETAARELFGGWEDAFAAEERGQGFRIQREVQRGSVAWGEGEWSEAAEAFDRLHTDLQPCQSICVLMAEWGVALDEAGRDDDALEVLDDAVHDGRLSWHLYRTMWHAPALERIARIHEARGEAAEAVAAWQEIVTRFGDGDGPFADYAARARARLAALQ